MSDDFSLERSRWWNTMKLGLCCKAIKSNAACVIERAGVLAGFSYDAPTGAALAEAETELTEALLAIKVARESYERVTLQAAE